MKYFLGFAFAAVALAQSSSQQPATCYLAGGTIETAYCQELDVAVQATYSAAVQADTAAAAACTTLPPLLPTEGACIIATGAQTAAWQEWQRLKAIQLQLGTVPELCAAGWVKRDSTCFLYLDLQSPSVQLPMVNVSCRLSRLRIGYAYCEAPAVAKLP